MVVVMQVLELPGVLVEAAVEAGMVPPGVHQVEMMEEAEAEVVTSVEVEAEVEAPFSRERAKVEVEEAALLSTPTQQEPIRLVWGLVTGQL